MADKDQIDPLEHQNQIEQYTDRLPVYKTYAAALKRVLQEGCAVSFPEAFVQSRAKTISSFAEKCVRRFRDYKDAVNQLSDLCGARVIVQTLEQVLAVRHFIEANFHIIERDDKTLSLSEEKFGYRDMHYVVGLRPDRREVLGITAEEQEAIGSYKAELQVRTWLQHAWADTLHDRMYKTPFDLPRDIRRTGALQAALMEEGDQNFNEMADRLDGMIANYTAFAPRAEVLKETEVQRLLLSSEPQDKKKPKLALRLARMLAACGEYEEVVTLLEPFENVEDANQRELLSELGLAQCKAHRGQPSTAEYRQGVGWLENALELCGDNDQPFVQDLRKTKGLLARGHFRLAWAQEGIKQEHRKARVNYQEAHELEPANPYYLSSMLCFEVSFQRQANWLVPMRGAIREAIATCRNHALAGIELPYAYFTAGRLSLLLGKSVELADDLPKTSDHSLAAFGFYARGLHHCLGGKHCVPPEVLTDEAAWLIDLEIWESRKGPRQWILDLLGMAERVDPADPVEAPPWTRLIVTGGAATMDSQAVGEIRPYLELALEGLSGVVVSGGTRIGVPGCVGEIAAELKAKGQKGFELIGYIPERLPHDAQKDDRYDNHVICGSHEFTPEQLIRTWMDILDSGAKPQDVLVVGFGGGRLSGAEYHLALALGATVAVFLGTGGASDQLADDDLWTGIPNLLPTPLDRASVRALVSPPTRSFSTSALEDMAMAFHENYVAESSGRLPDNMRPWPKLGETFKTANREQARFAVAILEACGFEVRGTPTPVLFRKFTDEEVGMMAEMEHGRWNIERLRNGWRPGPRDDASKSHDCLLPWSDLPEKIREYDRGAVRSFPEILMKAGLEVLEGTPGPDRRVVTPEGT
jgi:ppGpp synthetase/RelA/SpoT-type nucleotidyltranferase